MKNCHFGPFLDHILNHPVADWMIYTKKKRQKKQASINISKRFILVKPLHMKIHQHVLAGFNR